MVRRTKSFRSLFTGWPAKILALIAAVLLYIFGSYANRESRTVTVPLEVKLPESFVAVSTVPSTVTVRLTGDGQVIYLANPEMIQASIDFSQVNSSGIAVMPVVLEFDQRAFASGSITLEAQPARFRVMFETPQAAAEAQQ